MLTHGDGILPPSNTPSSKIARSIIGGTPPPNKTSESDLSEGIRKEKIGVSNKELKENGGGGEEKIVSI